VLVLILVLVLLPVLLLVPPPVLLACVAWTEPPHPPTAIATSATPSPLMTFNETVLVALLIVPTARPVPSTAGTVSKESIVILSSLHSAAARRCQR
jgi:hypothetical protein